MAKRLQQMKGVLGLAFTVISLTAAGDEAVAPSSDMIEQHWGALEQYCGDCHNYEQWAGGVAFDVLSLDSAHEDAEIWEETIRKLNGRLMPPPGKPQPSPQELEGFVSSMVAYLDEASALRGPHAGMVPIHRLNRTEYAYEVKRLLNLEIDPETLLPADTRADGFTNVAEVLQVSPTFLDQYIAAARLVSLRAVGTTSAEPDEEIYLASNQTAQHLHVTGLPLGTRGGFLVTHHAPVNGTYRVSINVSPSDGPGSVLRSYPTGWLEYEHVLLLTVDGQEVFRAALGGEADLKAVDQQQLPAVEQILSRFRDIPLELTAGPHEIGVTFIAKTFAESDRRLMHTVPGMLMDSIPVVFDLRVAGPFEVRGIGMTPSRKKLWLFAL